MERPRPTPFCLVVTNGLKICSRISAGTPGPVSANRHFDAFVRSRRAAAIVTRSVPPSSHRIISVLRQIDEDLLGEIFVEGNVRQARRHNRARRGLRALPTVRRRLSRRARRFYRLRCGERSRCSGRAKSRNRVTSALRRFTSVEIYPASSLASGFERFEFLIQHFRGAFDYPERIADFVGEAGGELAERGEALGAAGFGLNLLEAAICLLPVLRRGAGSGAFGWRFSITKLFTRIAAMKKNTMRRASSADRRWVSARIRSRVAKRER